MEWRKALPVHHTDTSDREWDGPAAEANLDSDGGAEYLRQAYAWVDQEADPDTKSAYKFIHHEVSPSGEIGSANIQACRSGIAVLNGARGGADIPPTDRKGVWNHLAAHIKDAGLEPPELRTIGADQVEAIIGEIESRTYARGELRLVNAAENAPVLLGVPAIPYNQESEDLGGFVEVINPRALDETLGGYDVVCCRDHEDHLVLGRVSAGTLSLENTPKGLNYRCILPATSYARDLVESVRRGDVLGNSFRFSVLEDVWESKGGIHRREILKMEIYEIGPVTMPAYPSTAVSLRSLLRGIGLDTDKLGVAIRRMRSGFPVPGDQEILGDAIRRLSDYASSGRGAGGRAGEAQQGLGMLRERLRVLEIG